MKSLLLRYGLKQHLSRRFRLLMVLLSLALGVAIFVSSFESVVAAQDAIAASAKTFATKAEWEVSRGRYLGIEGDFVQKIGQIPHAIVTPVIEAATRTVESNPSNFLVIGVDLASPGTRLLFGNSVQADPSVLSTLFLTPSAIAISRAFAERTGLKPGALLRLEGSEGPKSLTVAGIVDDKRMNMASAGSIGLMAIGEAARIFGKAGQVDKIEVAGVSKAQLSAVCPSCQIDPPGKIGSAAEDAVNRIRSLLGISVIALLVGVLLIYNSVQVAVLERMQDIAILRAIGATRNQILSLLLAEWFTIGLVGSLVGLLFGSGLAVALVEYTKRTVNTMVPLVGDARVQIGPALCLVAIGIGIFTTLAAAFLPAWAASNVRPLEILRPYTYRRLRSYGPATWLGLVMFAVSNIAVATLSISYDLGIAITGIEFFGVALMFPQVVLVAGRPCRNLLARFRNPCPFLALDSLLKNPHRTAFTIMTFGCALMMTVATKALVAGFQASTGAWMNSAFPFDVSVMGNDLASSVYGSQTLAPGLVEKVRALPGVSHAYSVRKLFTPYQGNDVMAIGIDTGRYLAARREKGMDSWPPAFAQPSVLARFEKGKGLFVSNNFAKLYGVHPGDTVRLDTPSGSVGFVVLGEVDDYSWQHGALIVDLAALRVLWRDDAVSYIDASLAPGYALSDVKRRIQTAASTDRMAFAYDKLEIRKLSDSVLEQVVSMANLQAIIAIFIGVLGTVNAIWIGVMNRTREIALWRSIGVTRRQVYGIVVFEGFFIAVVAAGVGVVGGLYGGWVPLRSFSFAVTGYLYPCVVPWAHLAGVIVLAVVLGLLAGLIPARQAARLPVVESIGYE